MATSKIIAESLDSMLSQPSKLIIHRLSTFFEGKTFSIEKHRIKLKSSNGVPNPLVDFCHDQNLSPEETILLLVALAPHVHADFYDRIIQSSINNPGDFPQIGGVRGKQFRGFIPTGETVLFLLGGQDLQKRIEVQELFSEDHFFAKKRILWLDDPIEGEPQMSARILLSQEYIDSFTRGKISRPRFGMRFPAQLTETKMEWSDLILKNETLEQIKELEIFLRHGHVLMNDLGMHKKLKPGYRVLFHGPPGTGKTLTASLLGKYTGRSTYKIDLSMVVSKYIGETEKNLANLFAKAENKDWILFFDEADALFGKRTNVKDAHDKYANQEVSYLLQRVENYNGLVILATNFLSNIDDAFKRRFQSIIQFSFPDADERLRIWKNAFPLELQLEKSLKLPAIAQRYELSGAEIMNVVQYCCLQVLERGEQVVLQNDLLAGIKKEFLKEGKILN